MFSGYYTQSSSTGPDMAATKVVVAHNAPPPPIRDCFVRTGEIITSDPSYLTMIHPSGPNYMDGPANSLLKGQLTRRGLGLRELSRNERKSMKLNPPQPPNASNLLHAHFPIVANLWKAKEIQGPNKQLMFEMSLELNGITFVGRASTKKEAKRIMCERALEKVAPHLYGQLANRLPLGVKHTVPSKNLSDTVGVEAPELKPLKRPDEPKYPAEMLFWWCAWRRMGRPEFVEETLLAQPDKPTAPPAAEEGADPATAAAADAHAQKTFPLKQRQQVLKKMAPLKLFKCTVKLGDKSVEHTTAVSKKCAKQEACRSLLVEHLGLDADWLLPPQTQAIVGNATTLAPLRSMLDKIAQPNMPTSPLATLHALCMKCHGIMPVYSFEKTAQNQMNSHAQFNAEGRTEKEAKLNAAREALVAVFNLDRAELDRMQTETIKQGPLERTAMSVLTTVLQKHTKGEKVSFDQVQFKDGDNKQKWKMSATFRERSWDVVSVSTKNGKNVLAHLILNDMFGVWTPHPDLPFSSAILAEKRGYDPNEEPVVGDDAPFRKMARLDNSSSELPKYQTSAEYSQPTTFFPLSTATTFADAIGMCVHEKYLSICADQPHKDDHPPSVFYAGIVLATPNQADPSLPPHLQCIALGAGAHSTPQTVAPTGHLLYDVHAEVLARRALLLFLYQNLNLVYNPSPIMAGMSVFVKDDSGKLLLKPGHTLHMYINVTPQGDARVRAPPADAADASILRYYALNGSSIPCYQLQPATFASMRAVGGESVRVMSASDKLMRWTQLGMQGALLSHFIDPIHLETLVIGTQFDAGALRRALGERLQGTVAPSDGEQAASVNPNMPKVCALSSPVMVVVRPTPPARALIWSCAHPFAQLIGADTGMCVSGQPAMVSKQSLFDQFHKLLQQARVPQRSKVADATRLSKYSSAKQAADDYQNQKAAFMTKCVEKKLGVWQTKPAEAEQFGVAWLD